MIDLRTGKEMTRGGFLKGILAAGVAPSIISSALAQGVSVGGLRRGLGARTAMMSGGKSLPYDYEVEYLESYYVSGQNPFIRTGLIASENVGKVLTHYVRFQYTNTIWYQGADYGMFWGKNRNLSTTDEFAPNSWINGVAKITFSSQNKEYDLFAIGTNATGGSASNGSYYRWGRNTICLNGVAVRKYVPCIKDLRPCFYDEINENFAYSANNIDFIVGTRLSV